MSDNKPSRAPMAPQAQPGQRVKTREQQMWLGELRERFAALRAHIEKPGTNPDLEQARIRLAEAEMWAEKHANN